MMSMANVVALNQSGDEEEKFFPSVNPGIKPFGSRVLVQIRRVRTKRKSGIIITKQTTETILDNTCVAKVIAVGPLAYKNRNTMEPWSEGTWCEAGEYVFVPKYGGLRWEKPYKVDDSYSDTIQFAIFDDLNITGSVEDPLNDENETVGAAS
jgi:co-chaperonin GroES (HSP10)